MAALIALWVRQLSAYQTDGPLSPSRYLQRTPPVFLADVHEEPAMAAMLEHDSFACPTVGLVRMHHMDGIPAPLGLQVDREITDERAVFEVISLYSE